MVTSAASIPNPSSAAMALALNGPDSEPVLFQPDQPQKVQQRSYFEDDPRCRSCHSTEIVTDWKQGDRICTNCGVVVEDHIYDDRPEWRDFKNSEDLVGGLPQKARAGTVAVDETKYLGGLQPTILSKHAFGGDMSLTAMGKRLKATNKRLDYLMEKRYKQSLQDAKLDRKIRLKEGLSDNDHDMDGTIRPEMDQLILQEEEDAHRMQTALYAEKWSLDRAMLLHGSSAADGNDHYSREEEREEMMGRMDKTLRKASEDMYMAYSMLIKGAQKLHLPDRVRNEVIHRLVRFVTQKDGFFIKGISSRLSKGHDNPQRKKAAEQLREYNKIKQMGALGAAVLFMTARSMGWTRSVAEVCSSIEPPATSVMFQQQQSQPFVKPKHCSKAMNEVKATFPEYGYVPEAPSSTSSNPHMKGSKIAKASIPSESNDAVATSNFADHSFRRLQLPPAAEACARALVLHCRKEQIQTGQNSGTKLSTLCASVAYFVCSAGTIMQRLAQQTAQRQLDSKPSAGSKRGSKTAKSPPRKKLKTEFGYTDEDHPGVETGVLDKNDTDDSEDDMKQKTPREDDDDELFDVFSHDPIVEDQSEKHKYEMRRMWDAWAEQMPWSRSVSEVEQSCGVSRTVILEFYKNQLYPRRDELLRVLGDAVDAKEETAAETSSGSMLRNVPLARILLIHISTAAPLMNAK